MAWGPGDGRLVPGCPDSCFWWCCLGVSGFLGASSVRMSVNPMGILEGVASRPTGRAWLWRQQLSGPETPLEFQLWERGWLCGSVFSAGAFQADSAFVPSLLRREMGAGQGPHPARLPFSWRTGQEVGQELRKDVGSVPPAPPLRRTVRWMDGGGSQGLRLL